MFSPERSLSAANRSRGVDIRLQSFFKGVHCVNLSVSASSCTCADRIFFFLVGSQAVSVEPDCAEL